jgi:hypothetical protein
MKVRGQDITTSTLESAALVAGSLALVCLLEPTVFVTVLWFVPTLFSRHGGVREIIAWLAYGVLPLAVPVLAVTLASRRGLTKNGALLAN